jgi:hypothetical protein
MASVWGRSTASSTAAARPEGMAQADHQAQVADSVVRRTPQMSLPLPRGRQPQRPRARSPKDPLLNRQPTDPHHDAVRQERKAAADRNHERPSRRVVGAHGLWVQ